MGARNTNFTYQEPPDNIHHIGAPEAVAALVPIAPYHFQLFEMVLRAATIIACLGVAAMVAVGKDLLYTMG